MHYASAVFEGERMYDGRIFALEAHTERLFRSAQYLDFAIPYSKDTINEACYLVCSENSLRDCYIRPIAWRGAEQLSVSALKSTIHVAIAAWEWPKYFGADRLARGVRLGWATFRRPPANCAPSAAKAAGLYMICTVSKNAAENAGYDDALMLDTSGAIAETTGANIFFVRDSVLHTPAPDCFLDGITRRTVMALAHASGIHVIERRIVPEELSDFSECFIVGTAAEITPVSEIGEHRFQPSAITLKLVERYAALVHAKQDAIPLAFA
jgi:branched-chain amino acid aminotransferase